MRFIKTIQQEIEAFYKLISGAYENSTMYNNIGFSIKNKIRLDEDVESLVMEFAIKLGVIEIEEN